MLLLMLFYLRLFWNHPADVDEVALSYTRTWCTPELQLVHLSPIEGST